MSPLYSGSADEWSYLSTDNTGSSMTVEFIIDKFTNQMKKASFLKSHQFTVKDTLWHIGVVPESEVEDRKGHVGIFIHNDNDKDFNVSCKFVIGDFEAKLDGDKIKKNSGFGFPKFLTHQQCKNVLNDGKLTVKVDISVLEEEGTLIYGKGKQFNPIQETSSVLLKMFEDKAFTDFLVVCKGKSFPCHKVFLVGRSSVFKTMMETNLKEAKEATVELQNCTEVVAESFVKYFYTGQVDKEIMNENSVSFLNLGEQYDLAELKAMAEQAMIANLDQGNMVSFFLAGDLYQGQNLRAAAKTFLMQNRGSLKKQEGWKEALKDRVDLLLELMETI
eukprot:GFUD01025874.1.p1 GENE.GFUD01025874.1~~GFUD01025874.1.p1  ORF type:complete len:354 (+),score=90.93 GFUD01025874.1:67-1062(+)